MARRFFGTDGIRGKVGDHPVTPDFVLKLGWAAGRVLAKEGAGKVLIGKDTRISGYMFESALQAGLSAGGLDIRLLGPMPTPAIAYLTRTLHAKAGIVISASHNPYYDNGIKFFSSQGKKLSDELELAIEAEMDKPIHTVESHLLGKAKRIEDARGRYIEYCKSTIPSTVDLRGMKVVVDCANGATYHITPSVFSELGAEVIAIGVEPDGQNINDGCGSTNITALQEAVLHHKANFGVALDGDGDRVSMVDENGEALDGDDILFIIARSRQQEGQMQGAVVGTVMSNLGLEHALQTVGIDFKRAAVGDRYVLEQLEKGGWTLGGENSGHIICLDKGTTGDGTVAALQVVFAMFKTGKTLHELKMGMHKYPQILKNVPIAKKININESPVIQKAVKDAEKRLAGKGRVLLRASGTEPLIRVMVEGEDLDQVMALTDELVEVVRNAV